MAVKTFMLGLGWLLFLTLLLSVVFDGGRTSSLEDRVKEAAQNAEGWKELYRKCDVQEHNDGDRWTEAIEQRNHAWEKNAQCEATLSSLLYLNERYSKPNPKDGGK